MIGRQAWVRLGHRGVIRPLGALPVELLDLDAALRLLDVIDREGVRIVELRQFAGLSIEETHCHRIGASSPAHDA